MSFTDTPGGPAVYTTEPAARRRPPRRRRGTNRSVEIGGADLYLTASVHDDGTLAEVFLTHGKQGSTLRGLLDAVSILVSISLQSGVPLATLVDKFAGTRYEPMGMTDDPDLPAATSILDYVVRRLALDFGDGATRERALFGYGEHTVKPPAELVTLG